MFVGGASKRDADRVAEDPGAVATKHGQQREGGQAPFGKAPSTLGSQGHALTFDARQNDSLGSIATPR